MAGQLLTGTTLDASHLLQRAIELHFSFRGEMFSGCCLNSTVFFGYTLTDGGVGRVVKECSFAPLFIGHS